MAFKMNNNLSVPSDSIQLLILYFSDDLSLDRLRENEGKSQEGGRKINANRKRKILKNLR